MKRDCNNEYKKLLVWFLFVVINVVINKLVGNNFFPAYILKYYYFYLIPSVLSFIICGQKAMAYISCLKKYNGEKF